MKIHHGRTLNSTVQYTLNLLNPIHITAIFFLTTHFSMKTATLTKQPPIT